MAEYRLVREAEEELLSGVRFYNSQYPGFGAEFAREIQRLCRLIVESPDAGPEIRPNIRRRLVRRFPYSILYTMQGVDVVVLAIAHQSRKPGYWESRA